MWFNTFVDLRDAEFKGFQSIAELRVTALFDVPRLPGVYVLVRDCPDPPQFPLTSPAGHFKGKNPTVSIDLLTAKWVPEAFVVYIGKAGAQTSRVTLRSRLAAYLDFGAGMPVGHYGGRYIWQLKDAEDLVVCWKPMPHDNPREVEKRMLAEFCTRYGKPPFANCQR
jgi:hypothetical protein